jgi:hypothetical protein
MGDINSLHAHAKRLILGLRDGLERLESAEVRDGRAGGSTHGHCMELCMGKLPMCPQIISARPHAGRQQNRRSNSIGKRLAGTAHDSAGNAVGGERRHRKLACMMCMHVPSLPDLWRNNVMQRTSGELESVWRMHMVRENSSKRDVWKRWAIECLPSSHWPEAK